MSKRIITDIEYEAGRVALDPSRLKGLETVQDLLDDHTENHDAYWGVNYDDRVEFLQKNGYDITRENLVADLPNTTTPNPDISRAIIDGLEAAKEKS